MLMSDFVDWLIPDIPKDISLQIHKEKILMVELFMKEEQGKRLAARDNHNLDNFASHSSANRSSPRARSRPAAQDVVWENEHHEREANGSPVYRV